MAQLTSTPTCAELSSLLITLRFMFFFIIEGMKSKNLVIGVTANMIVTKGCVASNI